MISFKEFITEMPYSHNNMDRYAASWDITQKPYEIDDKKRSKTLGRKISEMKSGHHMYCKHQKSGDYSGTLYTAYNPQTKMVDIKVTGYNNPLIKDRYHVKYLSGRPYIQNLKAHEFYHHLIMRHKKTIVSDSSQSEGGRKVWERLATMPSTAIHRISDDNEKQTDRYITKPHELSDFYTPHINDSNAIVKFVASKRKK